MRVKFEFEVDEESYEYCCEIADKMVEFFCISYEEAIARVNSQWRENIMIGYERLLFHELPEDWANHIYYTHDSYWWMP